MRQIFDLLNAGGAFMYGTLTVSIVGVGVMLHRVFTLWFVYRLNIDKLSGEVGRLVEARDFSKAVQICSGGHPLQRIMRAALMRANRPEKEIRRAVETTAVAELARYRRGTFALPQLSNLATLFGLVGTIHGLIISFSGMQGVDAASRQAALSKGVAVAFYNTFFGLTVALGTVVAYLIVSTKQGAGLTRMEYAAGTLVDQLLTPADGQRDRGPLLVSSGGGGAEG